MIRLLLSGGISAVSLLGLPHLITTPKPTTPIWHVYDSQRNFMFNEPDLKTAEATADLMLLSGTSGDQVTITKP